MPINKNKHKRLLRLLLLGILTLINYASEAAQPVIPIDTLLKALSYAKDDVDKVDLLNLIGISYKDMDANKSAIYSKRALALADRLHYIKGRADALNNIGTYELNVRNYGESLKDYNESLKIRKHIGDQKDIGACYNNIANLYLRLGEYDSTFKFHFLGLEARIKAKSGWDIGRSLCNIGVLYQHTDRSVEALKFLFKALVISTRAGDKECVASIQNTIGSAFRSKGLYPQALEHLLNALEINLSIKDTANIIYVYNNIAMVFQDQKQNSKALNYYLKALEFLQSVKEINQDKYAIGVAKHNIGECLLNEERLSEAMRYGRESLKIDSEAADTRGHVVNIIGVALNHCLIGDVYAMNADIESVRNARKNYSLALKIQKSIGDTSGLAATNNRIGILFNSQGEYKLALKHCRVGLELATSIDELTLKESNCRALMEIYEHIGDLKNALYFYKKHIILKDSLHNTPNSIKMALMELSNDFKINERLKKEQFERQQEIRRIILEQEAQSQKESTTTQYVYIGGISAVIASIFGLLLLTPAGWIGKKRGWTITKLFTLLFFLVTESFLLIYHSILHSYHIDVHPIAMLGLLLPFVIFFETYKHRSDHIVAKYTEQPLRIWDVVSLRNFVLGSFIVGFDLRSFLNTRFRFIKFKINNRVRRFRKYRRF